MSNKRIQRRQGAHEDSRTRSADLAQRTKQHTHGGRKIRALQEVVGREWRRDLVEKISRQGPREPFDLVRTISNTAADSPAAAARGLLVPRVDPAKSRVRNEDLWNRREEGDKRRRGQNTCGEEPGLSQAAELAWHESARLGHVPCPSAATPIPDRPQSFPLYKVFLRHDISIRPVLSPSLSRPPLPSHVS